MTTSTSHFLSTQQDCKLANVRQSISVAQPSSPSPTFTFSSYMKLVCFMYHMIFFYNMRLNFSKYKTTYGFYSTQICLMIINIFSDIWPPQNRQGDTLQNSECSETICNFKQDRITHIELQNLQLH